MIGTIIEEKTDLIRLYKGNNQILNDMEKELTLFEVQTIYKCGRIITEYVIAEDRDGMVEKYMKHHDMGKIDEFSVIGNKTHVKKTDKIYGKKVIS